MLIGQNLMKGINPFIEGYQQGIDAGTKGAKLKGYIAFDVKPVKFSIYPDTIYNKKDGSLTPCRSKVLEMVPEQPIESTTFLVSSGLISLLICIMGIMMIIKFIKLINTINKSVIFDQKNINRLRFIGAGFIIFFIVNGIMEYIYVQLLRDTFDFEYYKISGSSIIHTLSLVIGLISFLIAEVFAIGLRLKEEQELTI